MKNYIIVVENKKFCAYILEPSKQRKPLDWIYQLWYWTYTDVYVIVITKKNINFNFCWRTLQWNDTQANSARNKNILVCDTNIIKLHELLKEVIANKLRTKQYYLFISLESYYTEIPATKAILEQENKTILTWVSLNIMPRQISSTLF